jgi:hypothetical protein
MIFGRLMEQSRNGVLPLTFFFIHVEANLFLVSKGSKQHVLLPTELLVSHFSVHLVTKGRAFLLPSFCLSLPSAGMAGILTFRNTLR